MRPKWINKKDFNGWINIIKHTSKGTFYAEFICDPDSEEQKKQAQYIYNHWEQLKELL